MKHAALLLSIVCLFFFVACGQGEKAEKATVSEPEKATEMAKEQAKPATEVVEEKAEEATEMAKEGGQDRYRPYTGLPLATYFSGLKLKWLLDNIPAVREAADAGRRQEIATMLGKAGSAGR